MTSYAYRSSLMPFNRSATNVPKPTAPAAGSGVDAVRNMAGRQAGLNNSAITAAASPAHNNNNGGSADLNTTAPPGGNSLMSATPSPGKLATGPPPNRNGSIAPRRAGGVPNNLSQTSPATGGGGNSPYRSLMPISTEKYEGTSLSVSHSADAIMMRRAFHGDTLIGPPALPTPPASPTASDPPRKAPQVFTIVFDLDETLVCNRFPGKAVIRPHAPATLQALAALSNENRVVELVLWTASVESVAREVLSRLDPKGELFKHHIFRDKRWFKETGYTKDLRRLGRDMSRTTIVENSPHSVVLNRQQSLLVRDFLGHSPNDTDLAAVREILEQWITSSEDEATFVPIADFLKAHPKVSPANHVIATPAAPAATTVTGTALGRGRGGGRSVLVGSSLGRGFAGRR